MYFLLKIKAMKWLQFLKFFLWNKNIHVFSSSSSGIRVCLETCVTQNLRHQQTLQESRSEHPWGGHRHRGRFLRTMKGKKKRESAKPLVDSISSTSIQNLWGGRGRSLGHLRLRGPANGSSGSEGIRWSSSPVTQWSTDNV